MTSRETEKMTKQDDFLSVLNLWIEHLFALCPCTQQLQPFNKVVGGLGFPWTEGYRRFVRAHDWPCVCVCKHSAMAGDWLMAERVQDAPSLLQIGTAETWQEKSSKLHTHTHTYWTYRHFIFFPQHQTPSRTSQNGGCRLYALHILSVLEPAKCHF